MIPHVAPTPKAQVGGLPEVTLLASWMESFIHLLFHLVDGPATKGAVSVHNSRVSKLTDHGPEGGK